MNVDDDLLIKGVSSIICDKFCVSDIVVEKRIQKEKVWKELNY